MDFGDKVNVVDSTFPCVLCLDQRPEADRTKLQCGCSFCRFCLTSFISVQIQDRTWGRLRCPGVHESSIARADLKRLLPRPLFLTYARHVRDRAVTQDYTRVLCPGPDCAAVCRNPGQLRPIRCADCGLKFCCGCRNNWTGSEHKCAVDQKPPERGAKHCPRCGITAFREGGCAKVHCTHCAHVYCWYCLANLETDPLHFINGSCRSPHARVWYNRCGLGFGICTLGILGLFVSPLLILCSPCACLCPWKRIGNVLGRRRQVMAQTFDSSTTDLQKEEMTDEEKDPGEDSQCI